MALRGYVTLELPLRESNDNAGTETRELRVVIHPFVAVVTPQPKGRTSDGNKNSATQNNGVPRRVDGLIAAVLPHLFSFATGEAGRRKRGGGGAGRPSHFVVSCRLCDSENRSRNQRTSLQ